MKLKMLIVVCVCIFTLGVGITFTVGWLQGVNSNQVALDSSSKDTEASGQKQETVDKINNSTTKTPETPPQPTANTTTPAPDAKPAPAPTQPQSAPKTTTTPKPAPAPTPTPAPTPAPAPAPIACGSAGGACTTVQVAAHNKQADCWAIYNGGYYILTSWVNIHPGGKAVFNSATCGQNITLYLNGSASAGGARHTHSASAYNTLQNYYVGPVQ